MPSLSSDALVLRTYKIGETSAIVVFLTRERGKVRAVAKGARGGQPRYQSALEPLSEVRVSLHGRQGADLYRLGACELVRSAFRLVSGSPERALAVSYYAELLDAFAQEGEAEDAVYRLALAVLRASEEGAPTGPLSRYLEAWLLRLHGIYPPLGRCASCDRPLAEGDLGYRSEAHGFVCDDCGPAAGPRLTRGARLFLDEVFRRPPAAILAPATDDGESVESLHQSLIANHLERSLRSYRILKDVARSVRP